MRFFSLLFLADKQVLKKGVSFHLPLGMKESSGYFWERKQLTSIFHLIGADSLVNLRQICTAAHKGTFPYLRLTIKKWTKINVNILILDFWHLLRKHI